MPIMLIVISQKKIRNITLSGEDCSSRYCVDR